MTTTSVLPAPACRANGSGTSLSAWLTRLDELLVQVHWCGVHLVDFQRGWVDDHTPSLIASMLIEADRAGHRYDDRAVGSEHGDGGAIVATRCSGQTGAVMNRERMRGSFDEAGTALLGGTLRRSRMPTRTRR